MYNLACLLGANEVKPHAREAVALYCRAIAQGNLVVSMDNLARILQKDTPGVQANPSEAVVLYRRAINGWPCDKFRQLHNTLACRR